MLAKTWQADINGELGPLYLDPRYSRLDLLLLDGFKPLKVAGLRPPNGSQVISHEQIKTVVAEQGIQASSQSTGALPELPAISVVICTRDRPLSLERCLRCLAELDYPDYEVIVIDNCSASREVYSSVARSGFRYIREDRIGLNWARNRAIKEARHAIVAYIDDDAFASRGWLKGVATGFRDPAVHAVTGLVLPAELETESQILFEQYGGMSKGFTPRRVSGASLSDMDLIAVHQYGVGANMAYRRDTFSKVGLFDTALDVGTPSAGAGDLDMLHRVLSAGLTLVYEPEAWVRHRHRRDRDGLTRQIYSNGRSFGVYLIKVWSRRTAPRASVARFALNWISSWLLARVVRSALRPHAFPFDISLAEFRGALTAPAAYFQTYRCDRTLRERDTPESV